MTATSPRHPIIKLPHLAIESLRDHAVSDVAQCACAWAARVASTKTEAQKTDQSSRMRILRGIDLKGSREAARNLILVRNSVVDFNISLGGIIGIRGKIDGIASQIVVEGLGIEGRGEQGSCHRTDPRDGNLVAYERLANSGCHAGSSILPRIPLTGIVELDWGGSGQEC